MQLLYFGVVEDVMDPLMLGRCRVRVLGLHSESKIDLPTENLPWAFPMNPIQSASVSGIGMSPSGVVPGSWVVVFFKDDSFQYPVMIGSVPGFNIDASSDDEYQFKLNHLAQQIGTEVADDAFNPPAASTNVEDIPETMFGFKDPSGKYPKYKDEQDTSRLARKQKINETIVRTKLDERITGLKIANSETGSWEQSPTAYNPQYPMNHVFETESGHIMEFDDTPGAERINIHHSSGTFIEIDNNGSIVTKVAGSQYSLVAADNLVSIQGSCVVNVTGDVALKSGGSVHVESSGDINVNATDNLNLNSKTTIGISTKSLNIDVEEFNVKATTQSFTVESFFAKCSLFAVDGLTYFNSGRAQAITPSLVWNGFKGQLKSFFVPSLEETAYFELEDMSIDQMKAKGIPVEDTGEKTAETKEEELEKNTEPPIETTCEGIDNGFTNNTQISKHFKIKDFLKPSSGGSIVDQRGMTKEEIACNLKYLAVNIADRLKDKYPTLIITSGFRRGSDKSQHNVGQAMDFQFSDCKTRDDYYVRVKEIVKLLPGIDQIIFEQKGSKTWIHVSTKKGTVRNSVLSYDGNKYYPGLTKFG